MSQTFTILALVAISVATVSASRECYQCNSATNSGHKSSKACKKDTFDTTVVPVLRVPESEKECHVCFKVIDGDDEVNRGCLNKADFKDWDDVYKFKQQDDCKKENGIEFCVCRNNYCNGAAMISVSFFTIMSAALLKMFF